MQCKFVLTDYIEQAMALAVFEELDDGTYGATIPPCLGVIAFGDSVSDCNEELRATLEDWILVGLKLGHSLPIVSGIDLNLDNIHEPVGPL